jgi:DNA-binding NtrC family response regulator
VCRVELPPLRERREDVPPLVNHFVRKFGLAMKRITCVSPVARMQLQEQPGMGYVRELENGVERAMVGAQEPEIREQDFTFKTQAPPSARKSRDEIERVHILPLLDECHGSQSRAADVLGVDRVTLHHKLKLRALDVTLRAIYKALRP